MRSIFRIKPHKQTIKTPISTLCQCNKKGLCFLLVYMLHKTVAVSSTEIGSYG